MTTNTLSKQEIYLRELADHFFYGLITLAEIKKKVSPKEFDFVMRFANRHSIPKLSSETPIEESVLNKNNESATISSKYSFVNPEFDTIEEVKKKIERDPRYQKILDAYMPLIEEHPENVHQYMQKAFTDFYELYIE